MKPEEEKKHLLYLNCVVKMDNDTALIWNIRKISLIFPKWRVQTSSWVQLAAKNPKTLHLQSDVTKKGSENMAVNVMSHIFCTSLLLLQFNMHLKRKKCCPGAEKPWRFWMFAHNKRRWLLPCCCRSLTSSLLCDGCYLSFFWLFNPDRCHTDRIRPGGNKNLLHGKQQRTIFSQHGRPARPSPSAALRSATHFEARLWCVRWSLFSITLLTLVAWAAMRGLLWSTWEDLGLLTSAFVLWLHLSPQTRPTQRHSVSRSV